MRTLPPQLPTVAFGPEAPGWGSWDWVGLDVLHALAGTYQTLSFQGERVPPCDALVLVKHALTPEAVDRAAQQGAVLYCPVDAYGSVGEIDASAPLLRCCARILIHCERLRRYFEPYAPVEFIDHHVKFTAPLRDQFRPEGFILWVGVRTNLPPLVEWVNANGVPAELRILTNPEKPGHVPRPEEIGFRRSLPVTVAEWTPQRQREWTAQARAALDIKGDDFRSRHKPPAKALDFLASGLPLAMNPESSPVAHLASLGFTVADPREPEYWLARDYWEETRRFGAAIRELLSLERIARRYRRIIDAVLVERGVASGGRSSQLGLTRQARCAPLVT